MKKLIPFLIGIGAIFIISFTALGQQSNAVSTTVVINNNTSISFPRARVKIVVSKKWEELGSIHPGNNIFTLHGPVDNGLGIIEVRLNNGQWLISTYRKHVGQSHIQLSLSATSSVKKTAGAAGLSVFFQGKSQQFFPVSEKVAGSPDCCTYYDDGHNGSFTCTITSTDDPAFTFNGGKVFVNPESDTDSAACGTFHFDGLSPEELIKTKVTAYGFGGTPIVNISISPHGDMTAFGWAGAEGGGDANSGAQYSDAKVATLDYRDIGGHAGLSSVKLCENGNCTEKLTGTGNIVLSLDGSKQVCVEGYDDDPSWPRYGAMTWDVIDAQANAEVSIDGGWQTGRVKNVGPSKFQGWGSTCPNTFH